MNRDTKPGGDTAPNARELLDAYFDGDLDRAGKGQLHEALRHDPVLADEFSRTSEAVSMLRQSASNTALDVDLTDRVLTQCDHQRGYLNKRGRRFVLAGRSAVALAALALTAGVVLFVRLTPPELRLPESQRPLSALLEGGNADANSMRIVPLNVHQELSDSVDQSKAERTIVFNLRPDPAGSFSPLRGQQAAPHDSRAARDMARLPLFAQQSTLEEQRATAIFMGPMPMDAQRSASVVRAPLAGEQGWWGRPGLHAEALRHPDGRRALWLVLRADDPQNTDRDRE